MPTRRKPVIGCVLDEQSQSHETRKKIVIKLEKEIEIARSYSEE